MKACVHRLCADCWTHSCCIPCFQMRLKFLVFLLLGGEALGSGLDSAAESAESFSDSSRGFLSSFSGGEV